MFFLTLEVKSNPPSHLDAPKMVATDSFEFYCLFSLPLQP